ncbi:MAG TPA: hypothetical protein VJ875_27000 [Pyrinomonadaceae bacterium]|nr:hypothetical protein [Pyrinomonadaceae bacterium]
MKKLTLATLILAACAFAEQQAAQWSGLAITESNSFRFVRQDADSAARGHSASEQLGKRPLSLPVIPSGDRCPVSEGSHNSVPQVGYIFCSGCYWFGKGPVYLALSWQDGQSDEATFRLDRVPHEHGAYRAKTPWVSKPDYSGPILIRGRRLDEERGSKLRFTSSGSKINERLGLDAPSPGKDPTHWSF